MALSLLKASDLPAATRGVGAATEPKVTITSVGQFRFNKLAAEIFGDASHIQLAWDGDKRVLGFVGTSKPNKEAVSYENKKDAKGALYLSGSRVCRLIGWDYGFSGNFVADAKADADKKHILITLPDPQPAAPPKKARKPKVKKEETAPVKNDDDLNLDAE